MSWTRLGLRVRPRDPAGAGTSFVGQLAEVARAAEAAGFDALWLAPPQVPGRVRAAGGLDPFVTAAALAAITSTIRLGCLDALPGGRAPAMLAKAVTSLDVLSNGRAAVGLGGYGDAEATVEALEIVHAMLSVDAPSFAGRRFRVREAWNEPRRRDGAPPVVVVLPPGRLDAALREAATRLAGGCVVSGGAPAVAAAKGDGLTALALLEAGGDAEPPAQARACLDAGADALVVDLAVGPDAPEQVARLAETLLPLVG